MKNKSEEFPEEELEGVVVDIRHVIVSARKKKEANSDGQLPAPKVRRERDGR